MQSINARIKEGFDDNMTGFAGVGELYQELLLL